MRTKRSGVFPAATTHCDEALNADSDATRSVLDTLVRGSGAEIVARGACGEINSLGPEEKRAILATAAGVISIVESATATPLGVARLKAA